METDQESPSSTLSDSPSYFVSEWDLGVLLPPGEADLIPVEILSEIFLLAVVHSPWTIEDIMLVCRRWRDVALSTPGLPPFTLHIRKATQNEVVQAFIQGRKSHLNVVVNTNDETDGGDFNADYFHASFMAAAQVASRWQSLSLISFPPPGEYRALQIMQQLEHLESFEIAGGCNLGKFLGPLMVAITTTTTPLFTKMDIKSPDAVLCLLQPACLHIFHSLRTLHIWLPERMQSPVDILPSLQRLLTFTACHLNFPIYPPDASLPFLQTLRSLSLKSVSVQWMAGRVFPVLDVCKIIYPHQVDSIQGLQPIDLPSCTQLDYESNNLGPLMYFSHPRLSRLKAKSGQWSVSRGNIQLGVVQLTVATSSHTLQSLELFVQCSERLLVEILKLVPALKWLDLGLASPHALSEAFFWDSIAPVATKSLESNLGEMGQPACQTRAPLLPSLYGLGLHYRRWLRGAERSALIPVLGDLKASCSNLAINLSFDEDPQRRLWSVSAPVKTLLGKRDCPVIIGISGPHGITPLDADCNLKYLPFKEAEYLHVDAGILSDIVLSTFRHLVKLRISGQCKFAALAKPPPHDLPFCNTLRVFDVHEFHQSYWAGQTFHKLEKCRVDKHFIADDLDHFLDLLIKMPVCTTLDVSLTPLATLWLPQISQLAVSFSYPDSNLFWSNYIATNLILSGLKLLHVHDWHPETDLTQILVSLTMLETLIISAPEPSQLDMDFFRAFVPMDLNGTSGVNESNVETQATMLCPMLNSLQIEGIDPRKQPVLLTVLEDVVILRAGHGSPLTRFTFSEFNSEPKRKFELIGEGGRFAMEMVGLSMRAKPFKLIKHSA